MVGEQGSCFDADGLASKQWMEPWLSYLILTTVISNKDPMLHGLSHPPTSAKNPE